MSARAAVRPRRQGGRVTLVATLAALAAALAAPPAAAAEPDPAAADAADPAASTLDASALAAAMDDFVRAELTRHHIPGAALVVVHDGQVVLRRGYGLADAARGAPVDPERTLFRVGSISKTVTAAAAIRLVEQGRLPLHADLAPLLQGIPVPSRPGRPITLFHLLTHTAGLDERLFGQHVAHADDWVPLERYLAERLPPAFTAPGHVIAYNDHHTALAGLLVERATGEPFPRAAERLVLAPLGMRRSTFSQVDLPDELRRDLAVGHRWTGAGHEPYAFDPVLTTPAAGLATTADDMARFLLAHLGGAPDVLPPGILVMLHARQFGHHPLLPGRAFGLAESFERGVRSLHKDGQVTGFRSRMFLYPEARLGWFLAFNLSAFGDRGPGPVNRIPARLTSHVLERVAPEPPAPPPPRRSPGAGTDRQGLERLAGTYRDVVGSRHSLEKLLFLFQEVDVAVRADGTLRIGDHPYVELETGVFRIADGRSVAVFRVPDGRDATHVFLGGGAYERVPAFETARATFTLAAAFTAWFVVALAALGVVALWRRRRGALSPPAVTLARSLAAAAAALGLGVLVVFPLRFAAHDFPTYYAGIPADLEAILVAGAIFAALALALAPAVVVAARRGASRGTVLALAAHAVVALLCVAFLATWRLLPGLA